MTHVRPEDYGFIAPRGALAPSEDEAACAAQEMGYPVALKVVSADILHKTDVGGVALGLDSEDAVRVAYRRMSTDVRSRAPEARVEGLWVEEMVRGGVETIIGLKNDAQFGPVIMFGLGGIFTELLDDVSFRVLPIGEGDAREMVEDIRGAKILRGYRGRPAVNPDLLVRLLLSAARLGMDLGDSLDSVDFNPVVVWENDHRVLDFKLATRKPSAGRRARGGRRVRRGRPAGRSWNHPALEARARHPPPGHVLQRAFRGGHRCVGHPRQDRLRRPRKPGRA